MPETKNIKAVEIDKNHEKRYVIIDATTGNFSMMLKDMGSKLHRKHMHLMGIKAI